jgi:hypothetical protein
MYHFRNKQIEGEAILFTKPLNISNKNRTPLFPDMHINTYPINLNSI